MKLFSKQHASSVLGLALDGNRLEAVVVRRAERKRFHPGK